jgi:hypothetical protein
VLCGCKTRRLGREEISKEDLTKYVSCLLQVKSAPTPEKNAVQEAFDRLVHKGEDYYEYKQQDIKNLIAESMLSSLIAVLKQQLANGSLEAKHLAIVVSGLLPDTEQKVELLQYSYLTRFNGLLRFYTLLEIARLRRRETVPIFIQTFDERGIVGKVEGGEEPNDLWEFAGGAVLSTVFFPEMHQWWERNVVGMPTIEEIRSGKWQEGLKRIGGRHKKKGEAKDKFERQWLEDKNFMYWHARAEDEDLFGGIQEELNGYFKVQEEAKKSGTPIDQETGCSLTREELKRWKYKEKIWEWLALERGERLLMESLVNAFNDKSYEEERFSILTELVERYHEKKIIPLLIEVIDSRPREHENDEPYYLTGGSTSDLAIATLEKWTGISCAGDTKEQVQAFKEKCHAFWKDNESHLRWDEKEGRFVVSQ